MTLIQKILVFFKKNLSFYLFFKVLIFWIIVIVVFYKN